MASQLLKTLDIEGKIVTTDALLTQREFCQQVCEAGADYAMPVKGNQGTLLEAIRPVFEPEPSKTHAASPPHKTFEQIQAELGAHTETHTTVEKENGWIQKRTLTTSTIFMDSDYVRWPGLAQIYQDKTERTHTRTGKQTQMTQYGITSLPPEQASAERLMTRRRGHWTIENLSHRTRDVVLHEDASQVRCGNIPQGMAAGRNATLTLLRTTGNTEIADALRYFAANPEEALALIGARIDN